jgi:gamma-glutamyltranspeptidase / glutathione hydrolase
VTAMYAEELARFPEAARTYLRDGRWPPRPEHLAPGDRVHYPALARTLELIGKEGPSVFYRGAIGEAIEAELRRGGGVVDRTDLARYRVRVTKPLAGSYRGVTLLGMPGATGCVTALEMLNILECFDLGSTGPATVRGTHLRAEALRVAFEDRLRWLGDPTRIDAPWSALGGKSYARAVPRESAPTAAVTRGAAWIPGASRAAAARHARRDPPRARPATARRMCAPWTATGPWCR